MSSIAPKDRDTQGKLKILTHTEETDHVDRTRLYLGINRARAYRGKAELKIDSDT